MALFLALYLVFASVIPAAAVEGSLSTTATAIKADLLYWEGNELIVKEFSGHEVRLVMTPETEIEGVAAGRLKTGDRIVAQVTEDKRPLSIILRVPDAGSGGSPSGSR